MRATFLIALIASLLVAACGSTVSNPTATSSAASLATLPATVEGDLIAGADEADVDQGSSFEYVFGTLTVGDENIDVLIKPSVLQAAALPDDMGKVRATLGSKTEQFGGPAYVVTALERL